MKTQPKNNNDSADQDKVFVASANQVSHESQDPNGVLNPFSKVGCVIVKSNVEISASANVLPVQLNSSTSKLKPNFENRYYVIEHAERAAIFQAIANGENLSGATLYCTRFPCSDCARAIISVGIKRVVTTRWIEKENKTNLNNWKKSQQYAFMMFQNAKLVVEQYKAIKKL